MKFHSNAIAHPITSSIATALLLSSLSITAFADSKVALEPAKDKVVLIAENSIPDIKLAEASKLPAEDVFKKLDTNQDGKLSAKEAAKDKLLSSNYDAADANHDGAVTIDEYIAFNIPATSTSSTN
ncbi:MAG: hypothetical protein PHD12_04550 [Methylotenera sp.]|jgi:hypothetical protein|nr:hypothetical protein [Methylotenera sp.]